jgi:hypothetical protein
MEPDMTPQLASHREGDQLRFEVAVAGQAVTAYITETVWRARYGSAHDSDGIPEQAQARNFLHTYFANRHLIDGAVARRVAAGARAPVVLRAADL